MKNLLLFCLICSSELFFAQSNVFVGNAEQDQCPGRMVYYELKENRNDTILWEFTVNGETLKTSMTTSFPHWENISWSVFLSESNSGYVGKIKVYKVGEKTDLLAEIRIPIISLSGWTPNLTIGSSDNPSSYSFPYGVAVSTQVAASAFYPNTNIPISRYRWTLPAGLTSPYGSGTLTLFDTKLTLSASACAPVDGYLEAVPIDDHCHGFDGNPRRVHISRFAPPASLAASATSVAWGEESTVVFTAQGAPGVESYEWIVTGGFSETGFFSGPENTLSLTHQGCSAGQVSVRALYCQGKPSAPTRVEVGVKPIAAKIEGPDAINASGNCQGEYRVVSMATGANNYSWHASAGLEMISSDALQCVVKRSADETDPPYTYLSFSFDGCGKKNQITKMVRARIEPWFYVYDETGHGQMYSGLKTKTPYYFVSISWPEEEIHSYRWTLIRPSTGDPTCYDCRFHPGLGELYVGKTTEDQKIKFSEVGQHTLRLQLQDACGSSVKEERFYVHEGTSFPGLRIYPNPASDRLIVETNASTSDLHIHLYNEQGACQKSLSNAPQKSKHGGVTSFEFTLSDLPEGRYFLHLKSGKSVRKEQIWIQRK